MAAMICPRCKVPMNHHADKLIEPRDARETETMDPALGGIVAETHTCPRCGLVGTRSEAG